MRFSAAFAISAIFASSALAAPLLQVRQSNDNDDDALLSSPLNGTSLTPGGTFTFTYRSDDDDDDSTAVRVALFKRIEIARDLPLTRGSDGRLSVSQNITLPADLAEGEYFIGVAERDDDDSNNDDGDDNEDNDDDDDDDDNDDASVAGANRTRSDYDDFDYTFNYPGGADDDERRIYVTVNATA